ncbi:hypothetical protein CYY_002476 [Polysphondylium violaceum]|uniref:WD40 repeat-containing protein n=1 Tax=Polysphondylium violaceum TaxID=133409 RepID=A0A8J4PZC2_9MYCE|nr:hypothetical protein CYY_002476 [Polysphondylium violaceum]
MTLIQSKLSGHSDSIIYVDAHKTKELLASSSDDGTVRLWDLKTNRTIKSIVGVFSTDIPATSLCFDNDYLLYCSHSTDIYSFDMRNESVIIKESTKQYKYNSEGINQLAFDSKYQQLGACDDSGQIKIIDIAKNKLTETLNKKHTNICSTIAFRPNSKNELISGSMDYSILHWDFLKNRVFHKESYQTIVNKKQQQEEEQGLQQNQILNPPFVNSVDVSTNGKYVAVGVGDGSLLINEISSFKQYVKISGAHRSSISQVHYPRYNSSTENYKQLISIGNVDKRIIMWDVSEEKNKQVEEMASKSTATEQENLLSTPEFITDRILINTLHYTRINYMTTSPLIPNTLYIGDLSNDLVMLKIVD